MQPERQAGSAPPILGELPLFALGFRAFFVLAGLSALLLVMAWKAIYDGNLAAPGYFPGNYWHAHEMLFGYVTAVIAGFLLTAVRNWTGRHTVSGLPLAGLCLLWLYGRALPFYHGSLPDLVIAAVDFAFLPTLAYTVCKPVIATQNYHNLMFVVLLLLMALGNGLMHWQALGWAGSSALLGAQLAVAAVILMILVIAGRIFPFFTERGLPGTLPLRNPMADKAAIATAAAVFVLQMGGASGTGFALLAVACAAANVWRVSGWYVARIWYVPLLWILYIGYAWIILAFLLTALSAFQLVSPYLALHGFTMGGIGVLTLGMMSRVSLGHTGRALRVSKAIMAAFVAINLAVAVRIFVPVAFPASYTFTVYASMALWLLAFALFALVYAPILASPRTDGQPG